MNIYSFNIGITEFAKISLFKVKEYLISANGKANLNNVILKARGASAKEISAFRLMCYKNKKRTFCYSQSA